MQDQDQEREQAEFQQERWELLRQIDAFLDTPLIALGFVWLGLLILDLTVGLNPVLVALSYAIWALFWVDFLIGITLAPSKLAYLRTNWLTAVALLLPALRVLRLFRVLRLLRAARAARSISLVRLITTLNRSMRAANAALGRYGIGYIIALTLIVTFAGAAGMYFLERPTSLVEVGEAGEPGMVGLTTYGDALWYTAMIMTTVGSAYSAQTVEGRVLTFMLALYALGVFGYITATIASLFIGKDVAAGKQETTKTVAAETNELQDEVVALREQIAALTARLDSRPVAAAQPERSREEVHRGSH